MRHAIGAAGALGLRQSERQSERQSKRQSGGRKGHLAYLCTARRRYTAQVNRKAGRSCRVGRPRCGHFCCCFRLQYSTNWFSTVCSVYPWRCVRVWGIRLDEVGPRRGSEHQLPRLAHARCRSPERAACAPGQAHQHRAARRRCDLCGMPSSASPAMRALARRGPRRRRPLSSGMRP